MTLVFSPLARGHRSRAGECFQPAGVGESGPVVADLGEETGAEDDTQTWEAGDDCLVGVLVKRGGERGLEVGDVVDGGVEGVQIGPGLQTHGVFDLLELAELILTQSGDDALGLDIDSPRAPPRLRAAATELFRRVRARAGDGTSVSAARAPIRVRSGKHAKEGGIEL